MSVAIDIETAVNTFRERSTFKVYDGRPSNKHFVYVKGGYVKYANSEAVIKSVDPIVMQRTKGTDLLDGQTFTPLYPYVDAGSIIESVNDVTKVNVSDEKDFPRLIIYTIDKGGPIDKMGYQDYNFALYLTTGTEKEITGLERQRIYYDEILTPLADHIVSYIKTVGLLTDYEYTDRERWGEATRYGREEGSNVFNEIVDCLEISGTLKYKKNSCND